MTANRVNVELLYCGRVSRATRGATVGLHHESGFAPFIWWNG
jgi:hypothetical protein